MYSQTVMIGTVHIDQKQNICSISFDTGKIAAGCAYAVLEFVSKF
jgi:hypothetical protein